MHETSSDFDLESFPSIATATRKLAYRKAELQQAVLYKCTNFVQIALVQSDGSNVRRSPSEDLSSPLTQPLVIFITSKSTVACLEAHRLLQ